LTDVDRPTFLPAGMSADRRPLPPADHCNGTGRARAPPPTNTTRRTNLVRVAHFRFRFFDSARTPLEPFSPAGWVPVWDIRVRTRRRAESRQSGCRITFRALARVAELSASVARAADVAWAHSSELRGSRVQAPLRLFPFRFRTALRTADSRPSTRVPRGA